MPRRPHAPQVPLLDPDLQSLAKISQGPQVLAIAKDPEGVEDSRARGRLVWHLLVRSLMGRHAIIQLTHAVAGYNGAGGAGGCGANLEFRVRVDGDGERGYLDALACGTKTYENVLGDLR